MKALNVKNIGRTKQSGFTIIELVVVILLLGILTATALPRFMDVTDEAHDAVVDAVRAGLLTGNALFHAQFIAEGENVGVALTDFNSNQPNASGYSVGLDGDADDALSDNDECMEVFIGLLQEGRPSVQKDAVNSAAAVIIQADIDAALVLTPGVDFVAQFTTGGICTFAYIAQFQTLGSGNIPVLEYNVATGAVVVGTNI